MDAIASILQKMDATFASTLTRKSANQRPSSAWAYLTKQILQVVIQFPKMDYYYVQVVYKYIVNLQVKFASAFKCSYKCSLSTVNLTVIFRQYFRLICFVVAFFNRNATVLVQHSKIFVSDLFELKLIANQSLPLITANFRVVWTSFVKISQFSKWSKFRLILNKWRGTYYGRKQTNLFLQSNLQKFELLRPRNLLFTILFRIDNVLISDKITYFGQNPSLLLLKFGNF